MEKLDTSGYLFSNRDLKKLIIPLIAEQFLTIFVGLADSIMVASVGEAAVSAVSLIDTVMVLIINTFAALATGGAIVAGQALGRNDENEGCKTTEQLLMICTLASTAIMVLVYIFKNFILHVVFGNIDYDVMTNCNTYLLIVTASIPFIGIYNVGAAIYRAMGDSKTPMIMSLVMNSTNLVGNAILLYSLKFGIEGAAIPTMLSRVLGGLWMLSLMKNKNKTLHINHIFKIRPSGRIIKKILYIGVPYGVENSMFQLGKVLVLALVSSFGTTSIAANAVANNVCLFSNLTGIAIGFAMSAVIAQCVGAGDYVQVRYYTKKLIKISYFGIIIISTIIILAMPFINNIYGLSETTAKLASEIVIYHNIASMIIWPLAFNLSNVLRASNNAGYCLWVAMISMWVFRIGFSFIFAKFMGMGVFGVWVAMTTDWLARAVCFIVKMKDKSWQH